MSSELTIQGKRDLIAQAEHEMGGEVLRGDLVLPQIYLMQALSGFVNADESKIRPGDIVKSPSGDKVGDVKTPLWIIPITIKNEWMNREKIGGKFEWRGLTPRTAMNEDDPREFTHNGTAWDRNKVCTLFGLLPGDLETFEEESKKEVPDLERTVFPVGIPFRMSSFTSCGKHVVTFFGKARDQLQYNPKVRPYHYMLPISSEPRENDEGKFFVFTLGKSVAAPAKFREATESWVARLAHRSVSVREQPITEANASEERY